MSERSLPHSPRHPRPSERKSNQDQVEDALTKPAAVAEPAGETRSGPNQVPQHAGSNHGRGSAKDHALERVESSDSQEFHQTSPDVSRKRQRLEYRIQDAPVPVTKQPKEGTSKRDTEFRLKVSQACSNQKDEGTSSLKGAQHSSPISRLDQLVKIQLSKRKLERWCRKLPSFSKTVTGCFVRLATTDSNDRPVYIICEILGVVETGKAYTLGTTATNKVLKLRHGNEVNTVRMEFVSGQTFTDSEFQRWKKAVLNSEAPRLPTHSRIARKQRDITEAVNYEHLSSSDSRRSSSSTTSKTDIQELHQQHKGSKADFHGTGSVKNPVLEKSKLQDSQESQAKKIQTKERRREAQPVRPSERRKAPKRRPEPAKEVVPDVRGKRRRRDYPSRDTPVSAMVPLHVPDLGPAYVQGMGPLRLPAMYWDGLTTRDTKSPSLNASQQVHSDEKEEDKSSLKGAMQHSSGSSSTPTSPPISRLAELDRIHLSRSQLELWCRKLPFFEEMVAGCFVRVCTGGGDRPVYRIYEILGVVETEEFYTLGSMRTNKALRLRNGDEVRVVRMEFVSNQGFTESEFQRWKEAVARCQALQLPTRSHIARMEQSITDAAHYETLTRNPRLLENTIIGLDWDLRLVHGNNPNKAEELRKLKAIKDPQAWRRDNKCISSSGNLKRNRDVLPEKDGVPEALAKKPRLEQHSPPRQGNLKRNRDALPEKERIPEALVKKPRLEQSYSQRAGDKSSVQKTTGGDENSDQKTTVVLHLYKAHDFDLDIDVQKV